MSTKPILYTFRRCPYAMRARMALLSAKVDFEWREIKLNNKPEEMIAISPKGTVPVLQLADGLVLEESIDIMQWVLLTQANTTLVSDSDLKEQLLWIKSNDRDFKYALDRYKYPNRFQLLSPLPFRQAGVAWLHHLESALLPNGFINSDRIRMADLALFPFVRQFSRVEPDWFADLDLPQAQAWLDRCLHLPVFIACMKKEPLWLPDDI